MKTRKKGQRSPFRRVLVVLKKLMHKTLIREIHESFYKTTTFSSLLA